jgi:signal transduction histidine kinase
LVPPSLLNFGLVEALEEYCNRINSSCAMHVTFQYFGETPILPKKIETTIYHILQELLNNSIKHAEAKTAILQINTSNDSIHITVEDNGKGYDINTISHGLGLNNVKFRIEFLNAEMDVKSDDNGTSVTIDIDTTKIPLL